MNPKKLLLLLFLFFAGCSANKIPFQKKEVDKVPVLLNAKYSKVLTFPTLIKAIPGGFLLYDYKTHKICRFTSNGHPLLCFGRKGRGSGEYLNVNGMWKFKSEYLVYDRRDQKLITYNLKGEHIKDIPIKLAGPSKMASGIDAISPAQLITPSGGKKDRL